MRFKRYPVLGVLLALPCLTSCDLAVKSVVVVIPDFESSQVQGAWFYRDGQPETLIRFELPTYFKNGEELLDYNTSNPAGADLNLSARVEREGQSVLLRLVWGADHNPALYRASTYNAAGESPRSGAVEL
jgi:hypothetical protein